MKHCCDVVVKDTSKTNYANPTYLYLSVCVLTTIGVGATYGKPWLTQITGEIKNLQFTQHNSENSPGSKSSRSSWLGEAVRRSAYAQLRSSFQRDRPTT